MEISLPTFVINSHSFAFWPQDKIMLQKRNKTNKTTKKRDFSDFSSMRFNDDLSLVDWDSIIVSKPAFRGISINIDFSFIWLKWIQTFNLTLHKDIEEDLKSLEQTVNAELNNLYGCLMTNELNLNTKKSNPMFRPRQKKIHYLRINK